MLTEKIAEIKAVRERLIQLEDDLRIELKQELARLPAIYGFNSVNEFVSAVKLSVDPTDSSSKELTKTPARVRGKRAKITDETRAQVMKMVSEGKTANEIAELLKISAPSVAVLKKQMGLTKPRK